MIFRIIILILAVLFSCCSTSKNTSQNILPEYNISFGSGGGFTGMHQAYYADSTGKVYFSEGKILSLSEKKYIRELNQAQIERLNTLIAELAMMNVELRITGNMTSFFVAAKSGKEYRITWSGENAGSIPDAGIKPIISEIENIIKTNK